MHAGEDDAGVPEGLTDVIERDDGITTRSIMEDMKSKRATVDAERERLRKLIQRHEAKLEKIVNVSYVDTMRALAAEVSRRMPGTVASVSGPFGMDSDLSMSVDMIGEDDGIGAFLQFKGRNGADLLYVDPNEPKLHFLKGSIAERNRMHLPTRQVPEMDELVEIVTDQIAQNRLRRFAGQDKE
jgi:hypothetical protein